MLIRRKLVGDELVTETKAADHDVWQATTATDALGFASPFRPEWETAHQQLAGVQNGQLATPFQPVTVRSFSVSKAHNLQAAQGYLERFQPRLAKVAKQYQRVTGRALPGLSPGKLWYKQPTYFMANPMTYVPSGVDVAFPSFSNALDYEVQIGFLLGAPLLDATPTEADRAVVAAVLVCDFSARDVQIAEMGTRLGPQKGKHFLSSMATVAVTANEVLPRWGELTGTVTVNGEIVSRPTARDARWTLGELLAHASRSERLVAGEMVSSGSLASGTGMELNRWLRAGDKLRLALPGVGEILHRITPTAR